MLSFGLILKSVKDWVFKEQGGVVDAQGHLHAAAGSSHGGQFVHQEIPAEHYTNTNAGHFKFWKVGVHGPHMITHNGRIGSKGVIHVKTFSSSGQARAAAQARTAEKLANGYTTKTLEGKIKGDLPVLNPAATGTSHATPQSVGSTVIPRPATPQVPEAVASQQVAQNPHEALLHSIKQHAFEKGISIEHSRVTGEPTHVNLAYRAAIIQASSEGVPDQQLHDLTNQAVLAGRAAFKAFHQKNPHAPDGMSHEEIVSAVREHAKKPVDAPTASMSPTPQPTMATPIGTPPSPVNTPAIPEAQASIAPNNIPPVVAPAPVIAPTPAAAPSNLATSHAALSAYDTPSKIKNAVYVAAHAYHKLLVAHAPQEQINDALAKLNTISHYSRAKLKTHVDDDMKGLAFTHVGQGIYRLPFKGRSKNKTNLPAAAQAPANASVAAPTVQAAPVATPAAPPAAPLPQISNKALQAMGSGFDPVAHEVLSSHAINGSGEHLKSFVAAHVQDVLKKAAQGRAVDPNKITMFSSANRRRKLKSALQAEGKTALPGGLSEVNIAKQYAVRHLAKYHADKAAEATAEAAQQAGVMAAAGIPNTPLAKATEALRAAAHQRGRNVAQYAHDSKAPNEYAALRTKIDNLKAKLNTIAGNTTHAKNIEAAALKAGEEERKAELVKEVAATKKVEKAAHDHGYALGYSGGLHGAAPTDAELATHKSVTETHMADLTAVVGAEKAKGIRDDAFTKGKIEGTAKAKAERQARINELTGQIQQVATKQGKLAATGQTLPQSTLLGHQAALGHLKNLVGEGSANAVHEVAHKEGLEAGRRVLTDSLEQASFAMGQHAGKNTEPTPAERLASEVAHSLVKQHISLETANKIAAKAHAEGKADALNPNMTPEKVKTQLTELGLERYDNSTGTLSKNWAKYMPKVGPKEFFKTFFGDAHANKANLAKLGSLSVSATQVNFSGNNIKLHGATAYRIDRDIHFDTKDAHHSYLKLNTEDQGKGSVKKMFQAIFKKGPDGKNFYQRLGMDTVSTYANLDGGGYAWAKLGFHYNTDSTAQSHQSTLNNRMTSAMSKSNGGFDPNKFESARDHVANNHIALPNADGTKTVRPYTEDDHKAMDKEVKALKAHMDNPKRDTMVKMVCMSTPILNALYSSKIKNSLGGDEKRPSFVKMIAHDTSWNATINMENAKHMAIINANIFG